MNLPDRIGGNIDLALTYALDEFQLLLFQTLYFNQRAGKYILMVISKEQSRAEFIELSQSGQSQFSSEQTNIRLKDGGRVKTLAAADRTIYSFSKLSDGEFHCSRINDLAGSVIDLKYSDNAWLTTIADQAGRTIAFSYGKNYVSAITQTWNFQTTRITKTGAVANREQLPVLGSPILAVGPVVPKRIPSNAVTPGYTKEIECLTSPWLLCLVVTAQLRRPMGLNREDWEISIRCIEEIRWTTTESPRRPFVVCNASLR